ncbi:hypothetical protein ABZX51_009072 [Aspergillus tubingensis]
MLSGLPYTEIHRRRSTPAPMQVSQSDSVQANPVSLAKQEMIFALFPSTTGSGVVHIEDPSDGTEQSINHACLTSFAVLQPVFLLLKTRQEKRNFIIHHMLLLYAKHY